LNFGDSPIGGLFYNPGIVKPFESPGNAGGLPLLISGGLIPRGSAAVKKEAKDDMMK
jgi:hypothetical protein